MPSWKSILLLPLFALRVSTSQAIWAQGSLQDRVKMQVLMQ
jgi:hypothetical protein